jgi:hypothetical protein
MARGLAEQLDPRIAPAAGAEAVLLEAKNLRWDKRGAISKRQGFTEMTNLDSAGDPLPVGTRGLFSTGTELCVVTDRQLYSYVDADDAWYNRGQVGPADGRTREIYHGQLSYTCPDLDVEGSYELLIARSHYERDPTLIVDSDDIQVSIVQSVQTTDGVVVVPPTEYSSRPADAVDAPHSPRACSVTTGPFGLWLEGTASPAALVRSDWDSSTPATAPAAPVTMFSDVLFDGPNRRTYDAIQIAGGWLLAYIRSTDNAVMIYRYNDSHVLQAAGSIAGPWYRVAVATGSIGQHYILLAKDNGGAVDQVILYAVANLGLGVNWFLTVDSLPDATARAMNLGCVEAPGPTVPLIHTVWDSVRANVRQSLTESVVVDSTGAAAGGRPNIYNATVRSRPFVHGGRTYCWLETAVAGVDERPETVQFFEAAFALDLMTVDDSQAWWPTEYPRLAGVHSVGAVLPFGNDGGSIGPLNNHLIIRQYARQCGSAGTVVKIGNSDYRYASTRIGQSEQDAQPRLTMDEVQWLFGELPIAARVYEGSVIIGGSFFTWFAGAQTEELSFVTPPVLELTDQLGEEYPFDVSLPGQADLPDGIYSYQAHWVSNDPRGNLHRSFPGNIIQWEKDEFDAVRLAFRTCPASLRFPRINVGRESTTRVHRAGNDAIQKQMTRPSEYRANSPSAHFVEVVDVGQLFNDDVNVLSGTGTPIYTTGGAEVEAACPEGGQIVAKVGDRIWISDLYRRERVQYSKELTPRTGTEDVLAPEFNEAFGFVVPSGRPVAGIGDLDGKAVVFTSEEIYVVSGRGPLPDGQANDFSGLVTVSTDTGCRSARSVVSTPFGVLFAGTAGIYLLDRTLQLSFIGAAVEDTLRQYPYVTSAVLVAERHRTEVRFTCNLSPPASGGDQGVIVVWNYDTKQWSVWELNLTGPLTPLIDACLHQGVYHVLSSLGRIFREDETTWYDAASNWVTMSASTAWLQGAGQSGWQRIRSATLLQESRDPHDLTVEVMHDFEPAGVQWHTQSYTWTADELAGFPAHPYRQQPRMGIRRQKCQAIRVRWFDGEASTSVTGQGYTMAGLTFELGIKPGTVRVAKEQRS